MKVKTDVHSGFVVIAIIAVLIGMLVRPFKKYVNRQPLMWHIWAGALTGHCNRYRHCVTQFAPCGYL